MDLTLEQLKHRIKKPLISFLPRAAFELITKKDVLALETEGLLNTLYFIDEKDNVSLIENTYNYSRLVFKGEALQSNIFELLKQQNSLGDSAFHFLLEHYILEVISWRKGTKFIKDEAKQHAKNYSSSIQSYLDIQHEVLEQHFEDLQKHFGKLRSTLKIKLLLRQSAPNTIINPIAFKSGKTSKSKKKDVPVMPSVAEVDAHLLKTIFNVKL